MGRIVGQRERWESKVRCGCGQVAKFTVTAEDGEALQLCRRHHAVWTVDRVRARLPRARYDLAESDATMDEADNVSKRIQAIRDHHYWRAHGVQKEAEKGKG